MKQTSKTYVTSHFQSTNLNLSRVVMQMQNKLWALFLVIIKYFSEIGLQSRNVVIVGTGKYAIDLYQLFNSDKSFSYKFMGFFDDDTENNPYRNHIKGDIDALKDYCIYNDIDEIYFTLPLTRKKLIQDLSKFADDNFIYFRIAADSTELEKEDQKWYYVFKRYSQINSVPIISVRKEPLAARLNQLVKRIFDIVFSIMALSVLIPLIFPLIALAIKLESNGPVFFMQQRPGKKNKLFSCFKFRTMKVNNQTELQATKSDPRITRVGTFLRKTSLDELPQFFNVLIGDMSVVGPRPNMVNQLEFYSQLIDRYSFRHFVTPGITGYAQVNGYRGETETLDLMEKRVEFDLKYMESWSFWLDLKIVFLTVWNIVKGEDKAY